MKKQKQVKQTMPEIKKFKLSDLVPAEYNPRTITDDALSGLGKSIERFGCVELIVVNVRGGKNIIVGGHQRYKALEKLGVDEAICVTVDCSKAEEKLLNLTLNNPEIQGSFIDTIEQYITDLKSEIQDDEAFLDLRINQIIGEIDDVDLSEIELPKNGSGDEKSNETTCPKCGFKYAI